MNKNSRVIISIAVVLIFLGTLFFLVNDKQNKAVTGLTAEEKSKIEQKNQYGIQANDLVQKLRANYSKSNVIDNWDYYNNYTLLTYEKFEEKILNDKSDQPKLVYFFNYWCAHCNDIKNAFKAYYDQVSEEGRKNIYLVPASILPRDEKEKLEKSLGKNEQGNINGTPTFRIFKNGVAIDQKLEPTYEDGKAEPKDLDKIKKAAEENNIK